MSKTWSMVVLTPHHHDEELNNDPWKVYDCSAGWFGTSKKALLNYQWETGLMLVTRLILRITQGTCKSNADSRPIELDPWAWGLGIIISKSPPGQAGPQPGSGGTVSAPGQLSSDVAGTAHLHLTTNPPLGPWAWLNLFTSQRPHPYNGIRIAPTLRVVVRTKWTNLCHVLTILSGIIV